MGHFSRDCPQGSGGGKRTCHTCGSEDHLARECPDKKDKGSNFFTKDSKADDGKAPSFPPAFCLFANHHQLEMTRTARAPPSMIVSGPETSPKTVGRLVVTITGMPRGAAAALAGKGAPTCCWVPLPRKNGHDGLGQNRTLLIIHCLDPRGTFMEVDASRHGLAMSFRWLFQGAHLS